MKKERKDSSFIKKPIYPGGNKALKEFVAKELTYPQQALENKIEGVVPIRYTVNKKGVVTETKVLLHLGHGCDEEAERIVRLLKFNVPKNRNIKVNFYKTINIRFRLPQKIEAVNYVYTNETKKQTEKTPNQTQNDYSYTINISR